MLAVFEIVLPVFVVIACGFALARSGLISRTAVEGLSRLVVLLPLPALLFRSTALGLHVEAIDPWLPAGYYLAAIATIGATFLGARLLVGLGQTEAALFGMAGGFSNTVLVGIPIVQLAYGEAGLTRLLVIIALHASVLIPLVSVVIELDPARHGGAGSPLGAAWSAFLAAVRNPLIVAAIGGFAYGATGLGLPLVVDRSLALLGQAAAPAALLALGATLAAYRVGGDLRHVAAASLVKLLVHPAVAWLVVGPLLGLDPLSQAVIVVTAALPSGANVFLLASHAQAFIARSASCVSVSTLLALASLGFWLSAFSGATP